MKIKSSSDGWRGIIADSFTFESLRQFCHAASTHFLNATAQNPIILVGYDRRFMAKAFAETAATVLASNGIKVLLSDDFVPTPALSWNVKAMQATGGLLITASHNPPEYCGVKLRENFGGPPLPRTVKSIEALLDQQAKTKRKGGLLSLDTALKQGKIEYFNFKIPYLNQLERVLDFNTIAKANLRVFVDTMHGAGAGYISSVLRKCDCTVHELRADENPSFNGASPDPVQENISTLMHTIKHCKEGGILLGLAQDGDADRIAAVDEYGNYFDTNKIFSSLLWHFYKNIGVKGNAVKTVSTTEMANKIADRFGNRCYETPVGFKHICQRILENKDILLGGEESGGIGISRHLPDKDGIITGLYLAEIIARMGQGLYEIMAEINNSVGYYFHGKRSLPLLGTPDAAMARLQQRRRHSICDLEIVRTETLDGVKYWLEDDSWLLIRAGTTEPMLRVYAESHDEERTQLLLEEGARMARG